MLDQNEFEGFLYGKAEEAIKEKLTDIILEKYPDLDISQVVFHISIQSEEISLSSENTEIERKLEQVVIEY
ncbi:hypothetical protein [Spirosoma validum]|uniref:Uncharacterized protein n=1 Tax=Spirosoma validum TaxID=2771355 RepID=A0A927GEQ6_9BACT|nr:hypothetical protein [Spirosoma validum]MBD2755077.1 hypothetical protein [Spirosoma validum]